MSPTTRNELARQNGGYPERRHELVTGSSSPWWMVCCLTLLSMLASIDKNILTLLVTPIKDDLGLSDTEIGIVIGAAFAVANLAVGLPAGWMADRLNRKALVGAGVALWSAMTVACGTSTAFMPLFVARAGVGLSEGLIPPACYSLIRDGVAFSLRGTALSIYGMATLVGAGLAFVAGGLLYKLMSAIDLSAVPLLRDFEPWALTVIAVGAAGLPLALLVLTFREPARTTQSETSGSSVGIVAVLRSMLAQRRIYLPLMIFSVAHAMLSMSFNVWLVALITRRFGLPPDQIGPTLGMILLIAGPIGLCAAGFAIDRLAHLGAVGSAIVAVALAVFVLVPATVLPLAGSMTTLWCLLAVLLLGSTTYLVVTSSIVTQVAASRDVGRTMSVFILCQGAFGSGVAPIVTPLIADHVFAGSASSLGYALSTVGACYGVIAVIAAACLYRGMRDTAAVTSVECRSVLSA